MVRTALRQYRNGLVGLLLLICFTVPVFGQTLSTSADVHHDVSQPLKSLATTAPVSAHAGAAKTMKRAQNLPLLGGAASGNRQDPVLQSAAGISPAVVSGPTA